MTIREHQHPRTFVFQPGEAVTVTVTKRSRNVTTRMLVGEGLKPESQHAGVLEFHLPKKNTPARFILDTDFETGPERLHTDPSGVEVMLSGSTGTVYRHLIAPGPVSGRWDFRIAGLMSSRTYYVCPEPTCPEYNKPVETCPNDGICPDCKKAKLIPITF
jgi:hypothetical protein